MQPAIDRRWKAVGDPGIDLPEWVGAAIASGAPAATLALPAPAMAPEALTALAKRGLLELLDRLDAPVARLWAFLPRPTDRDGAGIERYMAFNAGRCAAYEERHGGVTRIPASTCVGHAGDALVLHALSLRENPAPVENPRQRPAWRYSERFGPVPPTFVRAATAGGLLLASGTASVVGEDSMHAGDIASQCAETERNLESLAAAGGAVGPWRCPQIYVRDEAHLDAVAAWAARCFPGEPLRLLRAPLCRADLLVEVEAVADAR